MQDGLIADNVQQLKQLLSESFKNSGYPENDIVERGSSATDAVRHTLFDAFKGKHWQEISHDVIDKNFENLPLFSDVGFHYYLPAYLQRCLDDFSPRNLTCEFTIYFLCRLITEQDNPWNLSRVRLFTDQQREVVRRFLRLVKDDERFVYFHEYAEESLKKFTES